MPRWMVRAALRLLAVGLVGCLQPAGLGGSVGETHTLRYSYTRSYWLGPELVVSYQREGSQQPAWLVLNSSRQALVEGVAIPLAGETVAAPFAVLEHYVRSGTSAAPPFASIVEGTVRFEELGKAVGERVAGEFNAIFADDSTLWGVFDTYLVEP